MPPRKPSARATKGDASQDQPELASGEDQLEHPQAANEGAAAPTEPPPALLQQLPEQPLMEHFADATERTPLDGASNSAATPSEAQAPHNFLAYEPSDASGASSSSSQGSLPRDDRFGQQILNSAIYSSGDDSSQPTTASTIHDNSANFLDAMDTMVTKLTSLNLASMEQLATHFTAIAGKLMQNNDTNTAVSLQAISTASHKSREDSARFENTYLQIAETQAKSQTALNNTLHLLTLQIENGAQEQRRINERLLSLLTPVAVPTNHGQIAVAPLPPNIKREPGGEIGGPPSQPLPFRGEGGASTNKAELYTNSTGPHSHAESKNSTNTTAPPNPKSLEELLVNASSSNRGNIPPAFAPPPLIRRKAGDEYEPRRPAVARSLRMSPSESAPPPPTNKETPEKHWASNGGREWATDEGGGDVEGDTNNPDTNTAADAHFKNSTSRASGAHPKNSTNPEPIGVPKQKKLRNPNLPPKVPIMGKDGSRVGWEEGSTTDSDDPSVPPEHLRVPPRGYSTRTVPQKKAQVFDDRDFNKLDITSDEEWALLLTQYILVLEESPNLTEEQVRAHEFDFAGHLWGLFKVGGIKEQNRLIYNLECHAAFFLHLYDYHYNDGRFQFMEPLTPTSYPKFVGGFRSILEARDRELKANLAHRWSTATDDSGRLEGMGGEGATKPPSQPPTGYADKARPAAPKPPPSPPAQPRVPRQAEPPPQFYVPQPFAQSYVPQPLGTGSFNPTATAPYYPPGLVPTGPFYQPGPIPTGPFYPPGPLPTGPYYPPGPFGALPPLPPGSPARTIPRPTKVTPISTVANKPPFQFYDDTKVPASEQVLYSQGYGYLGGSLGIPYVDDSLDTDPSRTPPLYGKKLTEMIARTQILALTDMSISTVKLWFNWALSISVSSSIAPNSKIECISTHEYDCLLFLFTSALRGTGIREPLKPSVEAFASRLTAERERGLLEGNTTSDPNMFLSYIVKVLYCSNSSTAAENIGAFFRLMQKQGEPFSQYQSRVSETAARDLTTFTSAERHQHTIVQLTNNALPHIKREIERGISTIEGIATIAQLNKWALLAEQQFIHDQPKAPPAQIHAISASDTNRVQELEAELARLKNSRKESSSNGSGGGRGGRGGGGGRTNRGGHQDSADSKKERKQKERPQKVCLHCGDKTPVGETNPHDEEAPRGHLEERCPRKKYKNICGYDLQDHKWSDCPSERGKAYYVLNQLAIKEREKRQAEESPASKPAAKKVNFSKGGGAQGGSSRNAKSDDDSD